MAIRLIVFLSLFCCGFVYAQTDSTSQLSKLEETKEIVEDSLNSLIQIPDIATNADSIIANDSILNLSQSLQQDLKSRRDNTVGKLDSLDAEPGAKIRRYREELAERMNSDKALANSPELRKKMERRLKQVEQYEQSLNLKSPDVMSKKVDLPGSRTEGYTDISKPIDDVDLPEVANDQELQRLQNYTDKVENVKNIQSEQVDQTMDQQAAKYVDIPYADSDALKQFQNQLDAYQGNISKIQTKASVSEQMQKRAAELGSDLSRTYDKEVQEAQKRMRKLKQRYEDVESAKDIIKRKQNPLKGKALSERLIPGVTLQAHPGAIIGLDLSPHVSYRISPAFSAGLGASYRIGIWRDFENDIFTDDNKVYGGRILADFKVYKSFFAHGELEMMRYGSKSQSISTDWQSGLIFGISKKFSITRRLVGNVQGLYNISHTDTSPYKKPFFVRLNFEWKLKK